MGVRAVQEMRGNLAGDAAESRVPRAWPRSNQLQSLIALPSEMWDRPGEGDHLVGSKRCLKAAHA